MADPMINVLPVGDGACTILRPWPERDPGSSAVLDCGVWRGATIDRSEMLFKSLGGTLANVESFVVSHFDWDHWGGLKKLSQVSGVQCDLSSVELYYPAMPATLSAGLMAMLGGLKGTGSAVLDLQISMNALLAPGEIIHLRPLNSSSEPISLAGDVFDVLWPPTLLTPELHRSLYRAVEAVRKLASDLDDAGHSTLLENLSKANSVATNRDELSGHELNAQLDLIPDEEHLDLVPDNERSEEVEFDISSIGDASESYLGRDNESGVDEELKPLLALDLPIDFRDRYIKVLSKIRKANNDLSLVLSSQSGKLICFGDVGGTALKEVLKSPIREKYRVMLAPHHGTHKFPSGMPKTCWCISQGGKFHEPKWKSKHPKPHAEVSEKCWNTHNDGEFGAVQR